MVFTDQSNCGEFRPLKGTPRTHTHDYFLT